MLRSLALLLLLSPAAVFAGLFGDSPVKMLDPKGFKKVMKNKETSMVAFTAPWCGHCKKLGPEYGRAAQGLAPLVPLYAVDCDDEKNKRLCSEQGVQGFPTVKIYPRGDELGSIVYDGERTATSIFQWVSRRIPTPPEKLSKLSNVESWVIKTASSGKPRALLLTKDKKVPLLWKVLSNKFKDAIQLGTHRDESGETTRALGYDAEGKSKIIIFGSGELTGVLYDGLTKLDRLSSYFESVLAGDVDLTPKLNQTETVAESFEAPEPPAEPVVVVLSTDEEETAAPVSDSQSEERPKDEL